MALFLGRQWVVGTAVGVLLVSCNPPEPLPNPVTPTTPVIDSFSGTPNPSPQNVGVTFNWSVYDLDKDALTCKLDVSNDGTFEYTIAPCTSASRQLHVYNGLGVFTAKLEVTDDDGNVVTRTTNIEVVQPVENRPPSILNFSFKPVFAPRVNASPAAAAKVQLLWQVFDYDLDVVTCELDIGNDGSVDYVITPCNNNSQEHSFPGAGTYRAKLVATDDKGASSSSVIQIDAITEPPAPPPTQVRLDPVPSCLARGSTVTLTGRGFVDPINISVIFTGAAPVAPLSVTPTSLQVVVPLAAQDGPLKVSTPLSMAQSGFIRISDRLVGSSALATDATVQAGVDNVATGGTVCVEPGTYNENVTINKNLRLFSRDGRSNTTLVGQGNTATGTVWVTNNTTAVQIGLPNHGFTIIGIDNASPALESAALYFQGNHSGAQVRGNDIRANGDHGLLSEFSATVSGFIIDGNIFSGQTYSGNLPAGNGFANQFTCANIPRQLVLMGNSSTNNTSNITFSNNLITGRAGAADSVADCTNVGGPGIAQGNTLVTLDVANSTISNNTFSGTTARFASFLRVRRPGTTVSNNTFSAGDGTTNGLLSALQCLLFKQNTGTVTGNTLSLPPGRSCFIDQGSNPAPVANLLSPNNSYTPAATSSGDDIVVAP